MFFTPTHLILLLTIGCSVALNACDGNARSSSSRNDDAQRPPHIIFILADDLGFNDVGFHGSAQVPTPNIDALAYSGLILNRYYVTPICTPSRAALMTGKYPIHTGMQHSVLYGAEPRGLPLTEKLLPQYLNELGYSSHIAGKWHLGHFRREYTPLQRGFRTHVGYWTGHHDYFDHTAMEHGTWGLDMRNGMDVAYELHGKYTTDIITDEAVRVIAAHNGTKQPLFLYVSHAAVHSGNPYNPLPAPDDVVARLSHIEHYGRRRYAAMLTKLDESVGKIVAQLQRQNMLNDSLIIFSSDNGGPAEGFNLNHASNWPLRGTKNTLWEGGVRAAGLLWSPRLQRTRRVAEQTMHITDWLPTLLSAAGVSNSTLKNMSAQLDGVSVWEALSRDELSPRKSILHNIDDIWGSSALTMGDWKLVKGTNYKGAWDGWYGPAGVRDIKSYDLKALQRSLVGRAIGSLNLLPSTAEVIRLRSGAVVDCASHTGLQKASLPCKPLTAPCIFNVRDDPCEYYNLAAKYPEIVNKLLAELACFNETALPPANKPLDPNGDPRFYDHTWTDFGDMDDVFK